MRAPHTRPRPAWRDDDGTSLIELVIVCTLLFIVLGTMYMVSVTASNASDSEQAQATAREASLRVLDKIAYEMRQAEEINGGAGVFENADPQSVAFYSDVDHDGIPELVTYTVQGTRLYRYEARSTGLPPWGYDTNVSSAVVLDAIDGSLPVFTYYCRAATPTLASPYHPETISAVRVDLRHTATIGARAATVDLSTMIKIRSIHNDLDVD